MKRVDKIKKDFEADNTVLAANRDSHEYFITTVQQQLEITSVDMEAKEMLMRNNPVKTIEQQQRQAGEIPKPFTDFAIFESLITNDCSELQRTSAGMFLKKYQ